MYNNDDQYDVNDYDEDIRQREALLEEARNIEKSEDMNALFRQLSDLKRSWKRIPYWESAYEDTLRDEFDRLLDVFYSERRADFQNVQAIKEDLILQALECAESKQWNQASETMNTLMLQWKAAGSSGKENDDLLWERFNAARQTFFDRKAKYWEERKVQFENAFNIKKQLISEALALSESDQWQKTSEEYRALMDRWKAAGSAGREHEDDLWEQFHQARQAFYDRRNDYYEAQKEEFAKKYEQKRAFVEQAKTILEANAFTKEHTAVMKNLGVEWKQVGTCGKDKEDAIWNEFREVLDAYFAGLKKMNDQRHLQWRQRMMDARTRKQELIQNQRRQIAYMQQEIIGLIGERAIMDMEEEIEEKNEFIKQIEEELADIDKTLQEQ